MNRRTHDLVRDLHDEVAQAPNLAVASTRPRGTTRLELWLMVRDVLRKLAVGRDCSVLEIGCGVGVVGLPVARRARCYVGIDMTETALGVFRERLSGAGLDDRHADLRSLDFVAAPSAVVASLARFDRVLAYAVLHYVASEAEGRTFVERALAALEPGGRALFGNLPLVDLAAELERDTGLYGGPLRQALAALRAALRRGVPDAVGVAQTRRTRLANVAFGRLRLWLQPVLGGANTAPRSLPPGVAVKLSRQLVEGWVERAPVAVRYRWLPPAAMTPLNHGRADLLVIRDA